MSNNLSKDFAYANKSPHLDGTEEEDGDYGQKLMINPDYALEDFTDVPIRNLPSTKHVRKRAIIDEDVQK